MTTEAPKFRPKKLLVWALRAAILALVAWGIARVWQDAHRKFAEKDFSLASLDARWIALSCGLYIAANIPAAWFWRESMVAMGQHPPWWQTVRAYFVGHLGKYVPGKALVVVMRASLVRGPCVDPVVAGLAVFVETLTLMAVGAVLSAVIVAIVGPKDQPYLTMIAVGLGCCAGIPSLPPVFRAVVKRLPFVKSHPAVAAAVPGLRLSLLVRGWIAMTIGWLLMGLSLWAILKAMGSHCTVPPTLVEHWPLLTACIALGTVAGFLSMLPGGIGAREWVVITLVEPVFGPVAAIVSAAVMRLVSLLSEVGVSIILYACAPRSPGALPTDAPSDPKPGI